MTSRTARDVTHGSQVIFPHQIRSQRKLVCIDLAIERHGLVAGWLFISHIEHLVSGAQIFLRSAMALQAPLHLQRSVIEHQRHPIDGAVAGIAAHALVDVYAVIEINEIG